MIATAMVAAACSKPSNDLPPVTTVEGGVDIAGWKADWACGAGQAPGVDDTTIHLGVSAPLSGTFDTFAATVAGAQAYADQANAAGGVGGRTVVIDAADDELRARNTQANITSFTSDGATFAVIGVVGTANELAARNVISPDCVPSVGFLSGAASFAAGERSPWEMPGATSHEAELQALGRHLKEAGDNSVGLIATADVDGQSYQQAFEQMVDDFGLTSVGVESFDPLAETDARDAVSKLTDDGAETVVLAVFGSACPSTIGAWADPSVRAFVPFTCAPEPILRQAGKTSVEVLMASGVPPSSNGVSESAAAASGSPLLFTWGFTQAAVILGALERSQPLDRQQFITQMYDVPGDAVGAAPADDDPRTNLDDRDVWLFDSAVVYRWDGSGWRDTG